MTSPLIRCLPIGGHAIQRNDESRTLIVDNQIVQFTPTECRLLLPLLQGQPLSDTELAQAAFSRGMDSLVRESLDKHIDKIRGKLEPVGLSVYRLRRYGYILSISSD
jgi:DNA-binding response OmpR family regulator